MALKGLKCSFSNTHLKTKRNNFLQYMRMDQKILLMFGSSFLSGEIWLMIRREKSAQSLLSRRMNLLQPSLKTVQFWACLATSFSPFSSDIKRISSAPFSGHADTQALHPVQSYGEIWMTYLLFCVALAPPPVFNRWSYEVS